MNENIKNYMKQNGPFHCMFTIKYKTALNSKDCVEDTNQIVKKMNNKIFGTTKKIEQIRGFAIFDIDDKKQKSSSIHIIATEHDNYHYEGRKTVERSFKSYIKRYGYKLHDLKEDDVEVDFACKIKDYEDLVGYATKKCKSDITKDKMYPIYKDGVNERDLEFFCELC